jgi:hypothetical protein
MMLLTLASSRAGNKGDVLGYIYIFCWSGKRNINLLRDSSWKVLYTARPETNNARVVHVPNTFPIQYLRQHDTHGFSTRERCGSNLSNNTNHVADACHPNRCLDNTPRTAPPLFLVCVS